MKVLITTSSFGKYDSAPLDILKEKGCEVMLNPYKRKLTKEETLSLYSDGVNAVIAGLEIIDEDVISKAAELKVISRCGTGMDNVDLDAADKAGIKVFNTPSGPTHAVAELTIGLIFSLLRSIPVSDKGIRAGVWKKPMGRLLRDKQVGIIGFGHIGRLTASLLRNLGAKVVYYDPYIKNTEMDGVSGKTLEQLLKESDIVTLHLSYSKETDKLIGRDQLVLMKDTAYLVNTSRGGIVDEEALYDALKNGTIAGAAIDVFSNEPYEGPLKEIENVILTPHMGSYAVEARVGMEVESAENLLKGLKEQGLWQG